MSMIPPDPLDPPEQPVTAETPSAGAAPVDGQPQPAAGAESSDQGAPQDAPRGDQPQHRRRRRRRRHRPRTDATAAPLGDGAVATPDAAAPPAGAEASSVIAAEQGAPLQTPRGSEPHKRRRRRRRPRPEGADPAAARDLRSEPAGGADPAATAVASTEPRRGRAPGREGRRHQGARENSFGRDDRGRQSRDRREGEKGDARSREPRHKRDGRDGRRPNGRGRDRDRDDRRKKPEPKLYRMEAIVDRGFEDVPDPATEGATRRVDWTILKRTTTDQHTARTVSAVYVLQRDGVDTEFPQLSAARAAVNKSIVHPEKLTLSKADHAAARGGKK